MEGPYQMSVPWHWTSQDLEPWAEAFLLLSHDWSSYICYSSRKWAKTMIFCIWLLSLSAVFLRLSQCGMDQSIIYFCDYMVSLCGYSRFCPFINILPSFQPSALIRIPLQTFTCMTSVCFHFSCVCIWEWNCWVIWSAWSALCFTYGELLEGFPRFHTLTHSMSFNFSVSLCYLTILILAILVSMN